MSRGTSLREATVSWVTNVPGEEPTQLRMRKLIQALQFAMETEGAAKKKPMGEYWGRGASEGCGVEAGRDTIGLGLE